jgi:hypothetical protein
MRIISQFYCYLFGKNETVFATDLGQAPSNNNKDGNNNNLQKKTLLNNEFLSPRSQAKAKPDATSSTPLKISNASCFKILNDEMLTDNEIYLALELLKRQFQVSRNVKGIDKKLLLLLSI